MKKIVAISGLLGLVVLSQGSKDTPVAPKPQDVTDTIYIDQVGNVIRDTTDAHRGVYGKTIVKNGKKVSTTKFTLK